MTAFLELSVSVLDSHGLESTPQAPIRQGWTATVRQTQEVSLTASATTGIPVPTGTRFVLIDMLESFHCTLKGVSGDNGILIGGLTTGLGLPICLPVSASAVISITNLEASEQTIRVSFL